MLLMRFKESPDPAMYAPGSENKVMHARVQIGNSAVLMSDGECTGKVEFGGFSLSLTVPTGSGSRTLFCCVA